MVNTDKDELCQLLRKWDIKWVEEPNYRDKNNVDIYVLQKGTYDGIEDQSEKVVGYIGFFTKFTFTAEGKFVEMGAYE